MDKLDRLFAVKSLPFFTPDDLNQAGGLLVIALLTMFPHLLEVVR